MRAALKKMVTGLLDRRMRPLARRTERQEIMLRELAEAQFRTRAVVKREQGRPIRLVFICHLPSLWSCFDSIYQAAIQDPAFAVTVVGLPYRHPTLPAGQYKDEEVRQFLAARGIAAVPAYDRETKAWLRPSRLLADYVFYQTPYDLLPASWSVSRLAMLGRVCYLPYGTILSAGPVGDFALPTDYFRYASFIFADNPYLSRRIVEKFRKEPWFQARRVLLTGHPKLDYLQTRPHLDGTIWPRGARSGLRRVLWNTRWRTTENNCHFFTYKDFFFDFCRRRPDVDFAFRPHPFCFQNFIQTGEMSAAAVEAFQAAYAAQPNMTVDRTGDYRNTFLTSDLLVSDMSSLLVEFLATGKPVVYTHREDGFNEHARALAEGFYWVRNAAELEQTLDQLLRGADPLREKRQHLIREHLYQPEGGASRNILEIIREDFAQLAPGPRHARFENVVFAD